MKIDAETFRNWDCKAITLLGMSGVGKTRLARALRRHHWFHYSGDYRIGTRYLDEAILDNVKHQAMCVPFLRDLLRSDAIHIDNNLTIDNLAPLSTFLGKVGNPELGGLGLREFKRRQQLHRHAEIAAMRDVPLFIAKAQAIYGYAHFVNDAGGSLCELEDPDTLSLLAEHTLILYIEATEADEEALIRRAVSDPKPLYFPERFLDEQLQAYMSERELEFVAMIDPDEFMRWVFPRLFRARVPRYREIADAHGYTVSTRDIADIEGEADFLALVERALDAAG